MWTDYEHGRYRTCNPFKEIRLAKNRAPANIDVHLALIQGSQCLHDAFVFVSMCAWLAGLALGGRSGRALHERAASTSENSLL